MPYLIGVALALVVFGLASLVGFDRDRCFYPVVLIVIASLYGLFAVIGGSGTALGIDFAVALLFAAAAVTGFRTSAWLVAIAIAAHGGMDLVHHHLVFNAGVPIWWPGFCAAFDITAALYLALGLALHAEPHAEPQAGDLPLPG